jgi:molybdate transport system substrate-binding protein
MYQVDLQKVHPSVNLKVMSDGPLEPALVQIAQTFHRESGHRVEFVFGTSPVIHDKVVNGESADVLIIQPNFVAELVNSGRLVSGEHAVIARVGLGLMARADAPSVDISTLESFKATLLNARSLIFNNVASGNYFATLLERLGIGEAVREKVVRTESSNVFQHILEGDWSDIGVATIPLIKATKGARLLGPLPAELQNYISYAAALLTSASSPRVASAFISFLEGEAAKAAFAKLSVA